MEKLRTSTPSRSTQDDFHALVSDTFDTVCDNKVKLGGTYRQDCRARDGHKYVCVDEDFMEDVRRGRCLIYSFGLGKDWTFEQVAAELGCTIHAYDPTNNVRWPTKPISKNIIVHKIGITDKPRQNKKDYLTLENILEKNGHLDAKITYMKMDVEKMELPGLPVWIASGVLKNVQQIAFEVHLDKGLSETKEFFGIFKDLHLNTKFRIFNYDANTCWKNINHRKKYQYYHLFEMVLKKVDPLTPCLL